MNAPILTILPWLRSFFANALLWPSMHVQACRTWLGVLGLAAMSAIAQGAPTHWWLQSTALTAHELAIVVNEDDPDSRALAARYQSARGIPVENVITVHAGTESNLPRTRFISLREEVLRRTPTGVQAYVLAWTQPWRVDCMSITSAFAFGFDASYCSERCGASRPSPYFDSDEHAPMSRFGMRPTMLLAGVNATETEQLIVRGLVADFSMPSGTVYLVRTGDAARNVRAAFFADTAKRYGPAITVHEIGLDELAGRESILALFTGAVRVPGLDSLRFRPGAVADHLTSAGGQLIGGSQMSALEWLAAGATASYGTVVEPCNHLQKFPHPMAFLRHYLDGASLIEAYWKSVAWPGEGLFVGEPLARPFGARIVEQDGRRWLVGHSAAPRGALVERATSLPGPYVRHGLLRLPAGPFRVALPDLPAAVARITLLPSPR